jgi:hypothetical protein
MAFDYAARSKRRREAWAAAGKCRQCGGVLDRKSRRYCSVHAIRRQEQKRRWEARRRARGLCPHCGARPPAPGKPYCRVWYESRQARVSSIREGTRIWRIRVRSECFVAYGGKCACCGETEPLFLEIDHINGGGGKHRKEVPGGTAIYMWLREQGYPKGEFQLLCRNCNYGKHRNGGICPHIRPTLAHGIFR